MSAFDPLQTLSDEGTLPSVEPSRRLSRLRCVAKHTKERLLHDRAHLMRALGDYRRGNTPALSELELAILVDGIERRLDEIERELSSIDAK